MSKLILNCDNIDFSNGFSESYICEQLLISNNYKVTDENIEMLTNKCIHEEVLLEMSEETKLRIKNILKKIGKGLTIGALAGLSVAAIAQLTGGAITGALAKGLAALPKVGAAASAKFATGTASTIAAMNASKAAAAGIVAGTGALAGGVTGAIKGKNENDKTFGTYSKVQNESIGGNDMKLKLIKRANILQEQEAVTFEEDVNTLIALCHACVEKANDILQRYPDEVKADEDVNELLSNIIDDTNEYADDLKDTLEDNVDKEKENKEESKKESNKKEEITTTELEEMLLNSKISLPTSTIRAIHESLINNKIVKSPGNISNELIKEALNNSGYKMTNKNVEIIRENLITGTVKIEHVIDRDAYAKLLAENGFDKSDRNINMLIENKYYVIMEGCKPKRALTKPVIKKCKKKPLLENEMNTSDSNAKELADAAKEGNIAKVVNKNVQDAVEQTAKIAVKQAN